MSYRDQEDSQAGGEVVELYEWSTALGRTLLTSGSQRVIFQTETYEPETITRTEPQVESEEQRSMVIVVRMPADHVIPSRYIETIPAVRDDLVIHRGQVNDVGVTTAADGTISLPVAAVVTYFEGSIGNVSFKGPKAEIKVLSKNNILDRGIPKRTHRSLCNHVLYDQFCDVDPTAFQFAVTVASIDGRDVDVTGVPAIGGGIDATFFDGGLLLQVASGDARMVRQLVRNNGTSTISLILPFEDLDAGTALTLRAGCDHSRPICISRFANGRRFGGFAFVPTRNPFTSRIG